ncbi:MAG: hybrid sensor histidine kinase/response regulator [Pseudodesulfovibrio sp.]|nr:hybrid sensor histidine kinase/response regulator [Pseudodesulfovibrio sp.]
MTDEIVFVDEGEDSVHEGSITWKILIVDDQEDVHTVTRLVLDDFAFEGRKVTCFSAYSGREAKRLIAENPDTAVILLDVVMETNRAGLDVAQFIRTEVMNRFVRIILRTGQPGEAPEREVVTELDINDYRQKAELTADRLVTSVTTAIRSYRDLKSIDEGRRGLHLLAMAVAHQIRNRTVTIAGFANLIRKKESNSPDVAEHLATILHESSRLESMVRDVTNYASIQIGNLKPFGIRDLIEEAMDLIDAKIKVSGRTVQWDVFCPDQTVSVDSRLFVLAMEAIMQNGVDFSDGQPRIKVAVLTGRLVCSITVTDFGCGIGEKDLPFVYDPFFSLKPTGSGMGLCIVKKVAMEHQWDIAIESTPGRGTTMHVVIPRREITGLKG